MAPFAVATKSEGAGKKLGLTRGHMMVDTGASVTLATRGWVEAHGLQLRKAGTVNITGASGSKVQIVGTTSFTVQLTPTLELDVAEVVVSDGDFYQCLLGMDILAGKPGVLGPATIHIGGSRTAGSIQWP